MDEITLDEGVSKALDALLADRLALVAGAGLSMAAPSSLPSAASLAHRAKQKYDALHGATRGPLPDSIDDQAQYFFGRGELATVYLKTYIDPNAFAGAPNPGHFAVADLLLAGGIETAVSTNVDTLIEVAGNLIHGQVGVGISRDQVAQLAAGRAPLLKIHGCWTDPPSTIWAAGQIASEPYRQRIAQASEWVQMRILDRDILVVGYWTDWDYLNDLLEQALGAVAPSRVIVVDPCETAAFPAKAPALYALGERATLEFCHVRVSGADFLESLRVAFSQGFVRQVLHSGRDAFTASKGTAPDPNWENAPTNDAETLWRIRRDLEGCMPSEPAKAKQPAPAPLLGLTLLELQSLGATSDGMYWDLAGNLVRVLSAPNSVLHQVQASFARETPPATSPDLVIAVGSENLALPISVARGSASGTIARGASTRWLSRADAIAELGL